jgi:hypothetical protein
MTSQITVASIAFIATYIQSETQSYGLFFDLNLFMGVFHRCIFSGTIHIEFL